MTPVGRSCAQEHGAAWIFLAAPFSSHAASLRTTSAAPFMYPVVQYLTGLPSRDVLRNRFHQAIVAALASPSEQEARNGAEGEPPPRTRGAWQFIRNSYAHVCCQTACEMSKSEIVQSVIAQFSGLHLRRPPPRRQR